ncbi:hypothetical protein ACP4OV_026973 [Aristida adscensionis]
MEEAKSSPGLLWRPPCGGERRSGKLGHALTTAIAHQAIVVASVISYSLRVGVEALP